MTQIGTTALKRTLNLNDWLNTFAQYSLFGEFEGTDEFQDVIDDILEMLEETLTLEFIAELRNDEKFSEQAVDAIEDLYILMLEDDYEFELRMPSPKNQDRCKYNKPFLRYAAYTHTQTSYYLKVSKHDKYII